MNAFKRILSGVLVLTMLLAVLLSVVSCMHISFDSDNSDGDRAGVKKAAQTVTVNGKTLTLSDIDAIRAKTQEEKFIALTETGAFDDTFVEALKSLYKIYDADLYIWLANLYDPAVGGFYYSNSGRDNEGFLPDLESTAQALELLDKSGIDGEYSGDSDPLGEILSDETKRQIYNFASSLKGADGYFYHPQWGTNISSSRKGRDKGWGNDILNAFSDVAAVATAAAYSSDTILTPSLCTSGALATSKVVLTASTTSVPQFSSSNWDDLKAYMDYWLDVKKDSYTMGNTINSNIGAIQNNGLRDDLVNYLIEKQYPNGLWEEETSYNAINGLMKMCGFFGGSYAPFPNASAALNSMMSILLGEIDENGKLTEEGLAATETICYVYNPWVTMYKLVGAIKNEDKAAFDEFAELLKDNAPALMEGVYQKLLAFKKPDGGFSYFQDKTSAVAQGAPVAVPNTSESDVNSTGLAVSTIRYVLRVYQLYCDYEFEIPVIYTEYDSAYFLEVLESRTAVTKLKQLDKPITVTFDNDNSWEDDEEWEDGETETESDGGVVLYPCHSVINRIGDSDLDSDGNYKWFSSSITASPTDATNMVLFSATYVIDGSYASSASSTQFNMLNSGVEGNTYVFEGKMYFDTTNYVTGSGSTVAQLWFANKDAYDSQQSIGMDVIYSGGSLTIKESTYYGGTGGKKGETLASGIPIDKWVTLRFEITKNYSSDGSTVKSMSLSVYVNGTHKGTYDTGRVVGSNTYCEDFIINTFRISYYKTNASHFYLDDAYAAKVAESASVSDYYPGSTTDAAGCHEGYSLTVKNDEGEGIPGVKLRAYNEAGDTAELVTDENGYAAFKNIIGDWRVRVVSAPLMYSFDSAFNFAFDDENKAQITLDYATSVSEIPINAKTIVHSDKISIAFRIDSVPSKHVERGNVNLNLVYKWSDEEEWKYATLRTSGTNTEYAVFETEGVAAYELTRTLEAVAYIGDEIPENPGESSKTKEYSVAEFLYNKLYRDGFVNSTVESEIKAADCYLTLLEYGRTSQISLNKNKDKLVTDCYYIYTDDDATVDGKSTYKFVLVGESVTVSPTYMGHGDVIAWNLVDEEGNVVKTIEATGETTFELTEGGKLVPVLYKLDEYVYDFEFDLSSSSDFAICNVVSNLSKPTGVDGTNYSTTTITANTRPAGYSYATWMSLVTDPKDSTNRVLSIKTSRVEGGGSNALSTIDITPYEVDKDGNYLVFHTKALMNAPSGSKNAYHDVAYVDFYNADKTSTKKNIAFYRGSTLQSDGSYNIKSFSKETDVTTGSWYDLTIVIDVANSIFDVFISADGGETYVQIVDGTATGVAGGVSSISISANAYQVNSELYLDELSFIQVSDYSVPVSGGAVSYVAPVAE